MSNLTDLLAALSRRDSQAFSPNQTLESLGLKSSLALLRLQSKLEADYGVKVGPLSPQRTVGDVIRILDNRQSDASRRDSSPTPIPRPRGVSRETYIGIDLEQVDAMPEFDPLELDAFYERIFSSEELAAAEGHPEPTVHLAGAFCAKEALRKSAPECIDLSFQEVVVTVSNGRPQIATTNASINAAYDFQVSVSHTATHATAVVLAVREPERIGQDHE